METYDPQNPFERFKAFWLTLGTVLVLLVLIVIVRRVQTPDEPADAAAEQERLAKLQEVREAQSKAVTDLGLKYQGPQGGHLPRIEVPEALIARAVARLGEKRAQKSNQVIPGSKTQLEQQSQEPDPIEAFLKGE